MNHVQLAGNLTADPEEKALKNSDNTLTRFSIAVNEVWYDRDDKKQEKVHFINCIAWGNVGESFSKFHRKGDPVLVWGKLSQNRWETDDGEKRSALEVQVAGWTFVKPYEDNGEKRGGRGSRRDDRSERGRRDRDEEDTPEEAEDPRF